MAQTKLQLYHEKKKFNHNMNLLLYNFELSNFSIGIIVYQHGIENRKKSTLEFICCLHLSENK